MRTKTGLWKNTPTVFSLAWADRGRGRTTTPAHRCQQASPSGEHRCFHLNDQEVRYLRKVLRLKLGGQVDVVDGRGHLWTALLIAGDQLELTSDRAQPLETE